MGLSIGLVRQIAERIASQFIGVTIQSITFVNQQGGNYIYNVLLTNNNTVTLSIPIVEAFETLYILKSGNTNNDDDGNWRIRIDGELFKLDRREGTSWTEITNFGGSIESSDFIITNNGGSLSFMNASNNRRPLLTVAPDEGSLLGNIEGNTRILCLSEILALIKSGNQTEETLQNAQDVSQSGNDFSAQLTVSQNKIVLYTKFYLDNVPANTVGRISFTNSDGNVIAENISANLFRQGQGLALSDGENQFTFEAPKFEEEDQVITGRLQTNNTVDALGSNVDFNDGLGTRFFPRAIEGIVPLDEVSILTSASQVLTDVTAGTNISIDKTDPKNPVISSTASGGGTPRTDEEIQDVVGAMVSGNTETGIQVTYDDTTGKLDFVVTGSPAPPQATHTNYLAITSDNQASSVDTTLAVSSDDLNPTFTIPTFTENSYLQILQSMTHSEFTTISIGGLNQKGTFTVNDDAVTVSGQSYRQYVTTNMVTSVLSGDTVVLGGAV